MPIKRDRSGSIGQGARTLPDGVRPSVAAMDDILGRSIPVLDHGFVRVIDYMGNDAAIVQAARVSYGKGTKRLSEDRALIRYLMRHGHTTPFEMAELKLHVKLPIFVARQWVRHRTASINEYSARYSILDGEFYIPKYRHVAAQAELNRQGRDMILSEREAKQVTALLRKDAGRNFQSYIWMLNEKSDGAKRERNRVGVSRELARIGLPLSTYTQWYWKCNLHNILRFLRLRLDPHAQYEMRAYAEEVLKIVKIWVPDTYDAFSEYVLGAVTLSASSIMVVRRILAGEPVEQSSSGLSVREWNELSKVFRLSVKKSDNLAKKR